MTARKHNDEYGWKRGLGKYSEVSYPTSTKRDTQSASDKLRDLPDSSMGMPAGKMLGGSGPVSEGGPPRYKPKTGPRTNRSVNGR